MGVLARMQSHGWMVPVVAKKEDTGGKAWESSLWGGQGQRGSTLAADRAWGGLGMIYI